MMMGDQRQHRLLLVCLCLMGCSGGKVNTRDIADSGGAQCAGGEAPTVVELYCENTGLQIYTPTGEEAPTMTVWTRVEDADGDLGRYEAELRYDETIDGEVLEADVLGTSTGGDSGEIGARCTFDDVTFATQVFLRGGPPLYETRYEWGMIVTDANGIESALSSVACTTPDAEGEGEVK